MRTLEERIKYRLTTHTFPGQTLPHSVSIEIIDDEMDESPWLKATLDWQRGLDIWQSECIEPELWSCISNKLLEAMKEAKNLIDPKLWCCGEPK